MSNKISALAASSTARKVVGSLGVIGAAAAVAGMGTFGSFTDSATPANTTINTATLDINAGAVGAAIPVTTADFLPGDSLTRAVDLVNSGTSPLGSVFLNTSVATPSNLTTDLTNGLQMAVKSCSVAWTQGGTASAPAYTCSGTEQLLASVDGRGRPVPLGRERARPARVVGARRVVGEVEVDHQPCAVAAQVRALDGVQQVTAPAVGAPPGGAVAQRQEQPAAVAPQPPHVQLPEVPQADGADAVQRDDAVVRGGQLQALRGSRLHRDLVAQGRVVRREREPPEGGAGRRVQR